MNNYEDDIEIKCSIIRGGTSKGIYIMENELPKDKELRDKIILSIFGSPDIRQIDGLGGADTLTSKVAIVGPSLRSDADVDYTFGQVSITKSFIDYGGNCGNISSGVGVFAVNNNLVKVIEPVTKVRIHMTNTNKILVLEVPVKNGKAEYRGDYKIDGVPGTGAKIKLDWSDVVGGITGSLLPTGNPKDTIEIAEEKFEVSVIDAGNIVIFIKADSIGLKGTEKSNEIDNDEKLLKKIERIRGEVCKKIKLVDSWEEAQTKTPYQPFVAIVNEPDNYMTINDDKISKENLDILARLIFMQKMHKAYPVTGTVATGAAARVKGSIVYTLLSEEAKKKCEINIGHPSGIISVKSRAKHINGDYKIDELIVYRTARLILEGRTYVRI